MSKYNGVKNKAMIRSYLISQFLSGVTFITLALVIIGFIVFSLLPSSFWWTHEEVKPVKDVFTSEENLEFTSVVTVNRDVSLHYVDILKCDFNETDDYSVFSEYISHSTLVPNRYETSWMYNADIPRGKNKLPVKCFLVSGITAEFPFGLMKKQNYEGKVFEIIE